jgi:hypothetical protein
MYRTAFLLAVFTAFFGCRGETAKETASTVTKKTVEVGKSTLSGVAEGIDEGRKAAESSDGALLVTNLEELKERLKVEIDSVVTADTNVVSVIIVLGNDNDRPVRVTNLGNKGALLLLDQERFASELSRNLDDITVPEQAKVKVMLSFKKSGNAAPSVLRIWGEEFPIPAAEKAP